MKPLLISSIVLVGVSIVSALATDVAIEFIDYAKLKSHLPKGWMIEKVQVADAPSGWYRTKGGSGIQVSFKNPDVTVHDAMVGDYHPHYSFTLLPVDWEGTNKLAATFREGKIQEEERNRELQIYPDRYRTRSPSFYYFESYLGVGPWSDPFKDLLKYFENVK